MAPFILTMESKQNLRILTAKHTCKNKLTTLTVIYLGKKSYSVSAPWWRTSRWSKRKKYEKVHFPKNFSLWNHNLADTPHCLGITLKSFQKKKRREWLLSNVCLYLIHLLVITRLLRIYSDRCCINLNDHEYCFYSVKNICLISIVGFHQ